MTTPSTPESDTVALDRNLARYIVTAMSASADNGDQYVAAQLRAALDQDAAKREAEVRARVAARRDPVWTLDRDTLTIAGPHDGDLATATDAANGAAILDDHHDVEFLLSRLDERDVLLDLARDFVAKLAADTEAGALVGRSYDPDADDRRGAMTEDFSVTNDLELRLESIVVALGAKTTS